MGDGSRLIRCFVLAAGPLWPIASFADKNSHLLAFEDYLKLALIIAIAAVVGLGAVTTLSWLFRLQPLRVALAVAAGTVVFFNYGDMVAVLPGEFTAKNALYAVVLLAASAVTYAIAGREIVTRFLVASILIACVIPIAKIVVVHASRGDTVYHPVARTTRVEARPNVYLIAIDGYARADVLRKHVGLDIGPFIEQLEQRNVLVAPRSLANYSATFFSIASTLQFDYVVDANSAPVRFRQPYIQIMRGQSRTAKVFRELGYAYVHAASGWESSECGGQEDICLTGVRRLRNRVQSELHLSLIEIDSIALGGDPGATKGSDVCNGG